jgi:exopolyphosphatase / guanosine-5'-triphosphate,3'-diphosphate pyrophosphatase
MQATRRAVIDVGTNSVKLLVAEVAGQTVTPVREEGNQTRLGAGFYVEGRLQREAILRTAEAAAAYAVEARKLGVETPRLIATSAARDALNRQELVAAIERQTGLRLEIITGEQEAEWAYLGVTSVPGLANETLLLVEVGGGSTQCILGQGGHRFFQLSFPIGAVRWLELKRPSDPPSATELEACRTGLREYFSRQVGPALGPGSGAELEKARLIATGGTAAILARLELALDSFDRERIESVRLSRASLSGWVDRLWGLPLAERRKVPGLPPPRADVILTGAAIYEAAMGYLGCAEMRVSTRGLRFGAVAQPKANCGSGGAPAGFGMNPPGAAMVHSEMGT